MAAKKPRKVRRSDTADLDIQIGFFEQLSLRDPDWVELLQALAESYAERGRHGDSVRIDEKLLRLKPDDLDIRINLALSLTLAGRLEQAIQEMDRAIDLGYRDIQWITKNPSLAPLRRHPGYGRLRAKMRAVAAG
jgi:tetratricopeptide (TPR) repeat protein